MRKFMVYFCNFCLYIAADYFMTTEGLMAVLLAKTSMSECRLLTDLYKQLTNATVNSTNLPCQ